MKITPSKALKAELPNMLGAVRMEEAVCAPILKAVGRAAMMTGPDGAPMRDLYEAYAFDREYPGDPDMQDVAYRALGLNSLLSAAGVLQDPSEPAQKILHQALLSQFRVLRPQDACADPYLDALAGMSASVDGCVLGQDSYRPGQYLEYDEPLFEGLPYSGYVPRLAVSAGTLPYPAVMRDGKVLASASPKDIAAARPHAGKAHGSVLCLGLGLGWFAYAAHVKPEVRSVTVVEPDAGLVRLFRERMLPLFPHPDKVAVIEADPIEYVRSLEAGRFDYCFSGLSKDGADYRPYLAFRTAARRLKAMETAFRFEDSVLWYVSKDLIPVFTTDMCRASHVDPAEGRQEASALPGHEDLIRFMRRLTAQETVREPKDIRRLFEGPYLSKLLSKRKNAEWPIEKGDADA